MTILVHDSIDLPDMWVISDTHFFHKAIIEFAGRPEDHNELMLKNWRELVKPDDIILHLGDIVLGSNTLFDQLAPQLTGRKYLLRGNHDHKKIGWYRKRGFLSADGAAPTNYRGYQIHFSHFPQPRIVKRDPMAINVHGHIHELNREHPRLINVCVEQTDYKPVWIKDVLDKVIDAEGANVLQIRDSDRVAG